MAWELPWRGVKEEVREEGILGCLSCDGAYLGGPGGYFFSLHKAREALMRVMGVFD